MTARDVGFVHLHVHTAFSLREGALSLSRLIDLAAKDAMPALAVTDANNLFCALEFSEKAAKAGVQPIPGIQLSVDFGDAKGNVSPASQAADFANLVLLAATQGGYLNLMRLSSRAHLQMEAGVAPHVTIADIGANGDGLIALTGGPDGALDRAFSQGRPEQARARLGNLQTLFGDRLYIEIQRHGLAQEREVEAQLLDLAYRQGQPLVATNEPFFAAAADFEAHDALLCIAEGTVTSVAERRRLTPQHYFKTRAEMLALFADLEEATANSIEIARLTSFRPKTRQPIMPRFIRETPDRADPTALDAVEARELRRQAEEGLAARLDAAGPAPGVARSDYEIRLNFELDVIETMRFPGYFLIVADFIKFAK
jgi:DNA polymerase-3 subunit alpha